MWSYWSIYWLWFYAFLPSFLLINIWTKKQSYFEQRFFVCFNLIWIPNTQYPISTVYLRKLIDHVWGSVALNHRVRIHVNTITAFLWLTSTKSGFLRSKIKCRSHKIDNCYKLSLRESVMHPFRPSLAAPALFFRGKSLNIYPCYLFFEEVPPSALPFNLISLCVCVCVFLLLAASGLLS